MLLRARNLSPSKLKPIICQCLTKITKPHLQNPTNSPLKLLSTTTRSLFFFSQPTKPPPTPPLPSFTRDGNYDDATPTTAVCPGCGIHMQDTNPKQPGFFIKATSQTPPFIERTHLVPVSTDLVEFSNSLKRGSLVFHDDDTPDAEPVKKPVVCARCHALRHYEKVNDPTVENLLPDFDFNHTVGRKLLSATKAGPVVLMVVDGTDFDGPFPRKFARMVSKTIEENKLARKECKSGNVPRVVLVVTKLDLLPSSEMSVIRTERWVRQRAREIGLSRIDRLHFVSVVEDWGLKGLMEDVFEVAGRDGMCVP